jgi:riboflavin kinase/FMN adenylyltransferase
MNIYRDINELPLFKNAIITIGTFDGVHKGHRQILNQLIEEANEVDGTPIVITFYPHPKQIVGNDHSSVLVLNTLEEKSALLAEVGIEHLVVVPFTKEFAEQSAEDYIKNFLVRSFKPHTIIIGYDHRFGKNRSGNYELLEIKGQELNYKVKEIPEHILHDITISSTKIRKQLLEGSISTANELLGYDYFFSGNVITGKQLGRTIGFPTANLAINNESKLIPGNGVYAVTVQIENDKTIFNGMMNIGVRPTFEKTERAIEVNIFDFESSIYDKELTVHIRARLRDEIKFDGIDSLKNQLNKDREMAVLHLTN